MFCVEVCHVRVQIFWLREGGVVRARFTQLHAGTTCCWNWELWLPRCIKVIRDLRQIAVGFVTDWIKITPPYLSSIVDTVFSVEHAMNKRFWQNPTLAPYHRYVISSRSANISWSTWLVFDCCWLINLVSSDTILSGGQIWVFQAQTFPRSIMIVAHAHMAHADDSVLVVSLVEAER